MTLNFDIVFYIKCRDDGTKFLEDNEGYEYTLSGRHAWDPSEWCVFVLFSLFNLALFNTTGLRTFGLQWCSSDKKSNTYW